MRKLLRISKAMSANHFRLGYVFTFLCFVVGLVYFGLMLRNAGLTGDEGFYFNSAQAISSWLWYGAPPPELIETGWYMPGMSILISPSQFFENESKVLTARIWVFIINCYVLWLTVVLLLRIVTKKIAVAYAVIMVVNPLNTFYAFTLWGDLIAGQLVVIAILLLVTSVPSSNVVRLGKVALAGTAVLAAVYMRSNFILVFPLLAAGLLWSYLCGLNAESNQLKSIARFLAAIGLVFAFLLGLAPWSSVITERFNAPILTTTSLDLAVIGNYADDQFIDELEPISEHPGVNIYNNLLARSNAIDMPLIPYMRQERDRVLARVSVQEVFMSFSESVKKVYVNAGGILKRNCNRFVLVKGSKVEKASCDLILSVLPFFSTALYVGAFAFLVLTLGRNPQTRLLVLMTKGLLISFFALNLVHWGNGRYIHNFLPGMTLASVLMLSQFRHPGWSSATSLIPPLRFIFFGLHLFSAMCAILIAIILLT